MTGDLRQRRFGSAGAPPPPRGVPSLAQRWRLDAVRYEEDRLPTVAAVLLRCAEQLEGATRESESALVTLTDGARLSGYSPRQLSRLVHRGRIPNYGSETRPKVAVGDLPRKPGLARAR